MTQKDLKKEFIDKWQPHYENNWNIKFKNNTIKDLMNDLWYVNNQFPTECRECHYPVVDYSYPYSYNPNLIWYDCTNCGFEGDYEE